MNCYFWWTGLLAVFIVIVVDSRSTRLTNHINSQMGYTQAVLEKIQDKIARALMRAELQHCRDTAQKVPCVICIDTDTSEDATDTVADDAARMRPPLSIMRLGFFDHWPLQDIRRCKNAYDSLVVWAPSSVSERYGVLRTVARD